MADAGLAAFPVYLHSGADLSDRGDWRFRLWRIWDESLPVLLFVMLNPSTADAKLDDPTIKKCVGFARRKGFGGIYVVNMFAWRATDPEELKSRLASFRGNPVLFDPVGEGNDDFILAEARACSKNGKVVVAWGSNGAFHGERTNKVLELLRGIELWCLGKTKKGHPRHPLMLPYSTKLERWAA